MSRVFTWDGSFELLADETLLEGLERQGYEVEYQCRSGYCGSCRTDLLDCKVEYLTEPLAYVNEGEILPCCCRPAPEAKIDVEVIGSSTAVEPKQETSDGIEHYFEKLF